ncbi:MAG TPA: Ig-like domain-containing protein [Xanthomonadales bacterium]|nr:Ig-like domain-containing protein [Xanthomonadales bacterium]
MEASRVSNGLAWAAGLLLGMIACSVQAQETTNVAPRVSGTGISGNTRSTTFCFSAQALQTRLLGPYVATDTNIEDAPMRGTILLTRGAAGSTSSISIPSLASNTGLDPDPTNNATQIRFVGRIGPINQALADVRYTAPAAGAPNDIVDIIVNDLQTPALTADVRFHITPQVGADTAYTPCVPAPDLVAASDTGASSTDDITSDDTPTFLISGVANGQFVELIRKEAVVASGTATGPTIQLTDTDGIPVDDYYGYSVRINGGLQGADLSIAYITVGFSDGFED